MDLKAFIRTRELKSTALAEELGISQPYAWRLKNGRVKRVSPELALKIQEWSGGEVPANTLSPVVAAIQAAGRPEAA